MTETLTVGDDEITVEAPGGLTLDLTVADLDELPPTPPGVAVPYGAIAVSVGGLAPGAATTLTVTLPGPVSGVRKLVDGSWDRFTHDGTTGATMSPEGDVVTVSLVDGGRGDADGAANGVIVDPLLPLGPVGPTAAAGVSVGASHSCATRGDGTVTCWGNNEFGQVRGGASWMPTAELPTTVSVIDDAVRVYAAMRHSCAIRADATLWCWGADFGLIMSATPGVPVSTPTQVPGISDVVAYDSSASHSCAVAATGTVSCWGRTDDGQLGDGATIDPNSLSSPVTVVGITDAVDVSVDIGRACALLADGRVKCWGRQQYGGLGDGSTTPSSTPVEVAGITDAVAVSVGFQHTCVTETAGRVSCWGVNNFGELGTGATGAPPTTPVTATELAGASRAVAGVRQTCGIFTGGTVRCVGDNNHGALGNGTSGGTSLVAVDVVDVSDATVVSTSTIGGVGGPFVCASISDGTISCWGSDALGFLGDGYPAPPVPSGVPVKVLGFP